MPQIWRIRGVSRQREDKGHLDRQNAASGILKGIEGAGQLPGKWANAGRLNLHTVVHVSHDRPDRHETTLEQTIIFTAMAQPFIIGASPQQQVLTLESV